MSNLIQAARDQVAELTQNAYEKAAAAGALPAGAVVRGNVDIPKEVSHGDYASSFAMAGAKTLHMAPRAIAQAILDHLDLKGSYFQRAEIAGPGFLNFYLGSRWYGEVLSDIEREGAAYGQCDEGHGEKVMVEFVSANPTGPMHMGNARGGVLGDTLANVLRRAGCHTWKEFYVNDAGNQIHKFAESIHARYMQLLVGEENFPLPENAYHGDDIKELAQAFYELHGDRYRDEPEAVWLEDMSRFGLETNVPKMKEDLRRYKIEYDQWFFESELHQSGYIAETVGMLTERGWTYEKDGALWLKTTELLKQKYMAEGKTREQADKLDLKDDVLCRANGFYTYFAADIAYHRNKLEKRGFDKAINIWGADHHGHVARLQAALDGLGLDGSHRLIIVLMQLVNLLQDGKPVRMSKRSGKAIALHDLLDEVPVDAARSSTPTPASAPWSPGLPRRGTRCLPRPRPTPPYWPPPRRKRCSRPCLSSPRRSAWRPGTTIPPASTAIWWAWPGTSTAFTTPAASRARSLRCSPPGSSWPIPCAPSSPTVWTCWV